MRYLTNLKIGRKLLLIAATGLLQLLLIFWLSYTALTDSNLAAEKAQHYAHKMDVAEQMKIQQLEMARMFGKDGSLLTAAHAAKLAGIEKDYAGEIEYFRAGATTDEDRGLVANIANCFEGWKKNRSRLPELQDAVGAYLKYRERRVNTFQEEQKATVARVQNMLIGFTLFALVTALAISRTISLSITSPLRDLLKVIGMVSEGDVSHSVPDELLSRKDEIGTLAGAVRDMSENLRKTIGEIVRSMGVLSSASSELSATSAQMSNGSRMASDRAHSVATAAEEMSSNTMSVATGMEETTTSLSSVAAATEEMTMTIAEIAGNSEKARRITEEATRQARFISEQMNRLGVAAQEIGKVTDAITEISSQTNLLALNASIEAARAGNAGKGFAVVASEIKALAQQAATATDDIKAKIERVQSSTSGGVAETAKVSAVIAEISEIVGSIAAAIEQQSMTTRSIAQNISEASSGVKQANRHVAESSQVSGGIAREIAAVDDATGQIASGSEQVRVSATELSQVAEQLHATVRRFKI